MLPGLKPEAPASARRDGRERDVPPVAEGIVLHRSLAKDRPVAVQGVLRDLVHLLLVLQHLQAPLFDNFGPLNLLLGFSSPADVFEEVCEEHGNLLALLAADVVGLFGADAGLLHGVAQALQRHLAGVRGHDAAVLGEDAAAPLDWLAIQVRDGGARLLRNQGSCCVVRQLFRGRGVVEAGREVPDSVCLAACQPAVLDGAVRHVKLRVLGAEDLPDALGVHEDVLAQPRAHGDLQLVRAEHVVQPVVPALDLLADCQRQRTALQPVLALVDAAVPLRDDQLRPGAHALDREEERHSAGVWHRPTGVVEREDRAAHQPEDGLAVHDKRKSHAELLRLHVLLGGVERVEHPEAARQLPTLRPLGDLVRDGPRVPVPLCNILRGHVRQDAER
mmetsp:Transcript_14921/g.43605  ORF Transcript_14921/g.43605 Transcript_14921/m.43605 type:complete len:390 (-) Transcript_14921:549-1718(-)